MMNKDFQKLNVPLYFTFLFGFVLNFSLWFGDKIATRNSDTICSRFIQSCEKFIFLNGLPDSWDARIFQFVIFLFLVASIYAFFCNKRALSLRLLIFPLLIEGLWGFILFEQSSIPFIYYHFFPCFIFLFSKNPQNDLKWLVVLLYVLSGWVKLDESWLAGGYFQALETGLPLFPEIFILPISLFVTFMELTSISLLFQEGRIKRYYFYFFCVFHIYSFIIVGYHYPILCLPLLIFAFKDSGPMTQPSKLVILCGFLLISFNLLPHLIDEEYKLTGQGDSLALNMFDGNRQSFSKMVIEKKNGGQETIQFKTQYAYERVKPFHYWFKAQKLCHEDVEKISWTLDISLNGSPFQKVVDAENLCTLEFNPLQKNSWVKSEGPLLETPSANAYRASGNRISRVSKSIDFTQGGYFQWIKENKAYIRWSGMILSLILIIIMIWKTREKSPLSL